VCPSEQEDAAEFFSAPVNDVELIAGDLDATILEDFAQSLDKWAFCPQNSPTDGLALALIERPAFNGYHSAPVWM